MSTNSSGSIRQALGRARAHAAKHVDRCKLLLDVHPIPWEATTTITMIAEMDLMKNDIQKLDNLWERWELFVDSIDEAEAHTLEEDLYNEWRNKPEYDDLMDNLRGCISKIKSASTLKITQPPLDVTQHSDDDRVSTTSKRSNEDTSSTFTPIQLSSLNIPKFDGDYSKWNNFWELFDLFIHQGKYAAVSKLAALRSLLQGRALAEIEGFNTCAANYETVVKTLKDRFGNQQFVIRELELKLDKIPSARPHASSIGSTVTAVTNLCRQLKNLGINIDNNSMKNNVIKKMPLKEQKQLQELLFDEPTTSIDTILDKMKKMEMKAELFASIDQSSTSNTFSSPLPSRRSYDSSNNSWNNKDDAPKSLQQSISCSFCGDDHRSVECRTYSSAEQRIQQLQRLKKCSNCMSKDHSANNCSKTNLQCAHCQAPHYSFLCSKQRTGSTTKALLSINKSQSSMLSKDANIYTADRDLQPATLFFDSGSQRSYVTTGFAIAMKLPRINKELLNVQGFGGKISAYNSDLVKIRIQTVDGSKEILANTTNKIADHMPVIQKTHKNKYTTVDKTPDILVGMDYFCKFITASKEIQPDLYEMDSIVGKMYSGEIPSNTNPTISSLAVDQQIQNGPSNGRNPESLPISFHSSSTVIATTHPAPTSAPNTTTPTTATITVPPTTTPKTPKRAKSPKGTSPSASKPVVFASSSAAADPSEPVESKFTKSPIKKPRTPRPIQITLGIRGDDLAPGFVKESSSTPNAPAILTHANNNGSTPHPIAPKEPLSSRRETKTAQELSGSTLSQDSSTSPATEKATTPDTELYPCAPSMSSSAAGWEGLSEKYYRNLLRERTSIDHKDARNALHHTNTISPCTIPYISHSHLSIVHEANCM